MDGRSIDVAETSDALKKGLVMVGGDEKPAARKSSSFVAALFAFILINILLDVMFTNTSLDYAQLNLAQNQEVMQELNKQEYGDLAFLGSSIVEVPPALLDRKHCYLPTSQYSQRTFSAGLNEPIKVRNFAIEAAMVSDQYLLLRRIARSANRPRFIVMSLAPRDFYDTRWSERSQTCSFRVLAQWSDLDQWSRYLDTADQWGNFIVYKTIRLYRMRTFPVR